MQPSRKASRIVHAVTLCAFIATAPVPALGQCFVSVDYSTNELVRVEINGQVEVIGPIGSDVLDVDLTRLNGVLYGSDLHFGPGYTDLVTLDEQTGSELTRVRITESGQDVIGEALAALRGELYFAYGPGGLSHKLGTVNPTTGVLTFVQDFGPTADMDGLGAALSSSFVFVDADSGLDHTDIYELDLVPPTFAFQNTMGSTADPLGLHDVVAFGSRLFANDAYSGRIYELDSATYSVVSAASYGAHNLIGLEVAAPTGFLSYCVAGTSASGCQATLSAVGGASASAASGFVVMATGVEGQKDGLFFLGANGRQASSWGNGTSLQCVVPPVKRGGLLNAVGTAGACDGAFTQDLNALWCSTCPKPLHNPGAGAVVQAQLWYRDPFNTSNQTTSLSDAIEFCVVP
jgi:hypothetical protein